jgi:hypothetical protein
VARKKLESISNVLTRMLFVTTVVATKIMLIRIHAK